MDWPADRRQGPRLPSCLQLVTITDFAHPYVLLPDGPQAAVNRRT